jgi:hypothetical protein
MKAIKKESNYFAQEVTGPEFVLSVNSKGSYDKMRITLSATNCVVVNLINGILVYSSYNNDFVGTVVNKNIRYGIGAVAYSDLLSPNEGMEFFSGRKMMVQQDIKFKLYEISTGNLIDIADYGGDFIMNILIEFFSYE